MPGHCVSDTNHPTTCGKVERFQQTLKKWLRAQTPQPGTITQLQALIDVFTHEYNHRPTGRRPTGPPRPPPTKPAPKPFPAPTAPATPTTGSATTRSTKPAPSPCASPDNSATSASASASPEPTSWYSSKTSTSGSSTPPPENPSAPHHQTRPRLPALRRWARLGHRAVAVSEAGSGRRGAPAARHPTRPRPAHARRRC
ncbi:integrase core domain-containing protein [Actinoplanes sp. NBRC 103695]|uniref:integrase core domain-containing protein n=1 Tax=Actinoplanes sp. NBRC 103695 TaxID=3032202 RepID=UPI00331770BE